MGIDAGGGGGIISAGPLVIAGSIVSRNSAGGFGGGISTSGLLTVVDSTISDNTGNIGGGLFIGGQTATIIGSTIANNTATDGSGGGVFSTSPVAIINSTLTGNFTNFGGGGLADSGGGGIIINTTIANNKTPFEGAALFGSNALAIYNTIVSGRPTLNQPACAGLVTSLGNNLFSDSSCGGTLLADDLTGDPRLGDFIDDGTPGHGFLPLLRRSPALNAADPGACLPTDQRGHRRTAKGCDIGAIEGTRP
jgi:predicted outer membrane repeat protein